MAWQYKRETKLPENPEGQSATVRRALEALSEDTVQARYHNAVDGWRRKHPHPPRETPMRETKAGAWLIE